jgi:hypothetical protein
MNSQAEKAIHRHADCGHHRHRHALDRRRRGKALHGFPGNRPAGEQEQQGVGERRQDRRAAQAIGIARTRRAFRQHGRAPGQQQSQHVGQVVAGVGHQRRRVGDEAVDEFDRDEQRIDADRQRKGAAMARLPCGGDGGRVRDGGEWSW